MSAADRSIRVAQMRDVLGSLGDDVAALVRDAYAEGYRDGLAGRAEQQREQRREPADVLDITSRRPTVV